MKVKIITPVHISSGEKNSMFFYRDVNDDIAEKYDFLDMLSQIQNPEDLLDKNTLYGLNKFMDKKHFRNLFKNINYNSIKPKYRIKKAYNQLIDTDEVYEQIKNIKNPYIPASSIKGNLMTAIIYDFAKKNFRILKDILVEHAKINKKPSCDFNYLISRMLQKKFNIEKINSNYLNSFSSCIECEDIEFNDLSLYLADRFGAKNGQTIPVGIRECIEINQISNSEIFKININKVSLLNIELSQNPQLKQFFNSYLDKDILLNLMFQYTQDMLKEELNNELIKSYEHGVLLNEVKSLLNNKNIIRIGNSTNYWFKTITKLIKDNDKNFYEKYFENLFKSGRANKFTMPKTRVIYYGTKDTLPGFIEITK